MLKLPHKYADFYSKLCSKAGKLKMLRKQNGPEPEDLEILGPEPAKSPLGRRSG